MSNTKKIDKLEKEVTELKQLVVYLVKEIKPEITQKVVEKIKQDN